MNRSRPASMLARTGLGFVAGFSLAWYLFASPSPQSIATATNAGTAPAVAETAGFGGFPSIWSDGASAHLSTPKNATVEEIWAAGKSARNSYEANTEIQEKLRTAAQTDPAALRSLIQRFEAERDPKAREMLKSVLSSIPSADVIALSSRLAVSGSAAQREDGFEMLKQISSSSPEVRNLVRHALATEQSPAVRMLTSSRVRTDVSRPVANAS
jgi:hypothetical protein